MQGISSLSAPHKYALAQQYRKNLTNSEAKLWQHIKLNALGFKFYRQRVLFGYIADFYCSDARLVIEVDGPIHDNNKSYDQTRDFVLSRHGIMTLRFTNDMVKLLL